MGKIIKVHEMYKELRPFYADMIQNGIEYYAIYKAQTHELDIVDYDELESRNQKDELEDGYFQIHEDMRLKDIFQQINDYVDEYEEYLRNERIKEKYKEPNNGSMVID